MWIRVCPKWQVNFNFKKRWKEKLFLWNQWWDWVYGAQSWKKKRLLSESEFILIKKRSWIPKNGGKKSFSYETKDPMSFIPTRRMSLWCSIMKKMEIIMRIRVCPKWQMNFKSKKWWKKKLFLWNQSINAIYPNK